MDAQNLMYFGNDTVQALCDNKIVRVFFIGRMRLRARGGKGSEIGKADRAMRWMGKVMHKKKSRVRQSEGG